MAGTQVFPTIETERLLLREIVLEGAPSLFEIHSDADPMRWFGNDAIADLADAEGLIKTFAAWRALANPGTRWGLEIKGESSLVGTCPFGRRA